MRGPGEPDRMLDAERVGVPCAEEHDAARPDAAAPGEGCGVSLAADVTEGQEAPQLAVHPAIQLVKDRVDLGLREDRDDEDVGSNVPRLAGFDAHLHPGTPS
jgi:hypothetical protein